MLLVFIAKIHLGIINHLFDALFLTFGTNQQYITGIGYESWHIRYVGVQVAQYMRDHHLSLEEFTEEWQAAAAAFEGL